MWGFEGYRGVDDVERGLWGFVGCDAGLQVSPGEIDGEGGAVGGGLWVWCEAGF